MFLRARIQDRMLGKRSKVVSSKRGFMSDATSITSPTAAALLNSPRLFANFPLKSCSESESSMSPTSTLETKHFLTIRDPFSSSKATKEFIFTAASHTASTNDSKRQDWRITGESRAIGLGIFGALSDEDSNKISSKHDGKNRVMFGSQLKIQIPPIVSSSLSPTASIESTSPIEFGIKNRDSLMALYSPARRSPKNSSVNGDSDAVDASLRAYARCLSPSEMELSEDYTCVIFHGPNPRTTHIFDNQVIRCCSNEYTTTSAKEQRSSSNQIGYASDDFLSFCYACKKNLEQGKDIFMYRGEKAFCSDECRYKEMLFDENMEK